VFIAGVAYNAGNSPPQKLTPHPAEFEKTENQTQVDRTTRSRDIVI